MLYEREAIAQRSEFRKRETAAQLARETSLQARSDLSLNQDYYCIRGCSSVGRANGSQSLGREFDPPQLHQYKKINQQFLGSADLFFNEVIFFQSNLSCHQDFSSTRLHHPE